METGLVLALIASVGFAAGIVIVRRATAVAGESFSATAVSIFTAIPLFVVVISISGEWGGLADVSWLSLARLGAAGIIHFIIGRLLGYTAFRVIGANKATPITMTSSFYTVILSVLFLDESLSVFMALGVVCLFTSTVLITTERKGVSEGGGRIFSGAEGRGILAALGASLCWGVTPALIKPAVREIGSPAIGALISYGTATIVMGFLLLRGSSRRQMARLKIKEALLPMVIAAVFTASSQLMYFFALGRSPASVVTSLLTIQVLFIFLFSLVVNRKIELFTPKVMAGMAASITGTVLLFQ